MRQRRLTGLADQGRSGGVGELLTRWLLLLKEQGEDAAFLQIRQELKELRRA